MKKTLITVAIVAVIIFLLALPKLNLFKKGDAAEKAMEGPENSKALMVDALILKSSRLDNKLNVTGSVLANESLELKSEVSVKSPLFHSKKGSK
ncbi:MAG: hypothetical protein IPJ20_03035 [Flammeovirgaceae bacterium]|nr:hypothetical protein [Flammeovirgaceae bacterium]